jgi:pimeloyl-ACP methyl ester carboxylesterase
MKRVLAAILAALCAACGHGEILSAPPAAPDAAKRYVFYLHGAIVSGSDGRPVSADFGPYEYRDILGRLGSSGFVVISEIRPDDRDPVRYAGRVAAWIEQLKRSGVPSARISVVGASIGGVIAVHVSALLDDRDIRYVILAALFDREPERDLVLHGRVLSIYDDSDNHRFVPDVYFQHSRLSASRNIVTRTGLGHGLIYTANPAWYGPAVDWIRGGEGAQDRPPGTRSASGPGLRN